MKEQAILFAVAFFALTATAGSATFSFRHGPLALTFDEATGALVRIARGGDLIAEVSPDRSPVSFAVGPKEAPTWLEQLRPARQLVRRHQPSPDALELTVRVGDYELVERYKLHASLPRLDRSATLINRGKDAVKLRAFTFRTPGVKATPDGFYRFPRQWPPASHAFARMEPGRSRSGGLSIAPLLAELGPARSLLWASCTDDPPSVRVEEGSGQFDVVQGVEAAGHLRPNQPQEIGFVTLQAVDAGYWDALPRLWDWFDSVGIKVPADTPDWVRDAILYCFHPGGTIGSNFTDLGGFKAATEQLLPTLPQLGVTAIWIMPIEWKSPYWPLDYYRFMDGLGTADDYKALVARAHELGLKVLQDIVPHGGAPHAVHNQAHPEFMLRREDGSTLNYWLNDFARPDWQDYIARVAAHYVREYGIDGYRVDACYGSKEMNWDPAVPYARASLARLWGGLGMVKRIRDEVRQLKPKDGAILAEVESARHAAVSDFQYDFNLCYGVLHAWRTMPAAQFVPALQDYLEEQKYVNPRGTLFLRHVESHDSLRAQGWYGVEGMRALYALTAWIDGVPLIYHDMEIGHSFALREINEMRAKRPELSRGEAFYRAVKCDQPGVFACLRTLGDKAAVAAVNLSRQRVTARLAWPGGEASFDLAPLAAVPEPPRRVGAAAKREDAPRAIDDLAPDFASAREWLVHTIEGDLHDEFRVRHDAAPTERRSPTYWRPQGSELVWQNATAPLSPESPLIGVRRADGLWRLLDATGRETQDLRLVDKSDGQKGLRLLGLAQKGALLPTQLWDVEGVGSLPPLSPPPTARDVPGVRFSCVGPDYIVGNEHFTAVLRRQGGVVRELHVGGKPFAINHDLYGDQEYFHAGHSDRIEAGCDVECGIRIWKADDGLHLAFEGQLRGSGRFDLKRPPLWYRNEYVFTDAPRFRQRWAFRTEASFKDRTAFLSAIVQLPTADRFRFLREGKPLAEDVVGEGGARRGQTSGGPAPDAVEFLAGGKATLRLLSLRTPEGMNCNTFVHGRHFFITLLDGKNAALEEGKWYPFEAEWQAGGTE